MSSRLTFHWLVPWLALNTILSAGVSQQRNRQLNRPQPTLPNERIVRRLMIQRIDGIDNG